ncbi:MAG: serine/threonine protein kinase [Candidatus Obscuribacterales bacterium]|nr:serine/threonine protein kinase [Candidatus Obscuribacterales bacterium]
MINEDLSKGTRVKEAEPSASFTLVEVESQPGNEIVQIVSPDTTYDADSAEAANVVGPRDTTVDGHQRRDTSDDSFGKNKGSTRLAALDSTLKTKLHWIWDLKVPLISLAAMAAFPKLILLWIVLILAKPVSQWLYRQMPKTWQEKLQLCVPESLRNSTLVRDLNEGADQGLPFILFWLYLFCAPFAIIWMSVHWVRGFIPEERSKAVNETKFVFAQNNRSNLGNSETNFYHSKVFGLVIFVFFALGIPSFISLALYERLGVEGMVTNSPSYEIGMLNSGPLPQPPQNKKSLQAAPKENYPPEYNHTHAPSALDSTVIQGYNGYWPFLRNIGFEPNKDSLVFIHFYLAGLGSALSVLFFRAWFSFPLNFIADDYDVEITESGLKRRTLKGWFLSVVTINRWAFSSGPDTLQWTDIKRMRRFEEGFAKLCPLPETIFSKETLTYQVLNRLAAFMEGITRRPHAGNFLLFSCSEAEADFGRSIKINLNDLSRAERTKLLYSVKKWAPHVVIDPIVEEQLVGSTVLKDNRYTQLWFNLLTTRTRPRTNNNLPPGETLKDGEYTVVDRISSGGQATTYLARKRSGEKCVLKEFILATSTSGALIESAREFEAEVGLLSQLSHPGIVKLEDFFAEDHRLYVALEYAAGKTLRQKVQDEGPLDEREVAKIALSVCAALEYLHNSNPPIVHRDVTPENIIVAQDGTIKLIDFSLAVRQDGRPATNSCGKQAFTPPEQFREEACVQSDIYALGATMYFLLTGSAPKPISRSSPHKKAPHVSDELNRIVEQATEPDLAQRYTGVSWLKVDLAILNKD